MLDLVSLIVDLRHFRDPNALDRGGCESSTSKFSGSSVRNPSQIVKHQFSGGKIRKPSSYSKYRETFMENSAIQIPNQDSVKWRYLYTQQPLKSYSGKAYFW
jgi:hypothetical protein